MADPKPTELAIDGMSCEGCVTSVRKALDALPAVGIVSIEVGRAVLNLPDDQYDAALQAIEAAGFEVIPETEKLDPGVR